MARKEEIVEALKLARLTAALEQGISILRDAAGMAYEMPEQKKIKEALEIIQSVWGKTHLDYSKLQIGMNL